MKLDIILKKKGVYLSLDKKLVEFQRHLYLFSSLKGGRVLEKVCIFRFLTFCRLTKNPFTIRFIYSSVQWGVDHSFLPTVLGLYSNRS